MLELKIIKDKYQQTTKGLEKRYIDSPKQKLNDIICLDDKRKKIQTQIDLISSKINNLSEKIGIYLKEGNESEAKNHKEQVSNLKDQSSHLANTLNEIKTNLNDQLYLIPNIPAIDVPQGKGDDDDDIIDNSNIEDLLVKELEPHWELVKKFKIIDFEIGTKISGPGFPVYIDKGAKLKRAMINFFLDQAIKEGYIELNPPLLVNENSTFGTGQLPDKEGLMYRLADDNLFLIPTSEVPCINIYSNTILEESQLPIKNVAYTPCFRREAGSWGSSVRGLNRLHQFDKVEIIQITKPEKSYEVLEEMTEYVEKIVKY